jgi:hypothetical protein
VEQEARRKKVILNDGTWEQQTKKNHIPKKSHKRCMPSLYAFDKTRQLPYPKYVRVLQRRFIS